MYHKFKQYPNTLRKHRKYAGLRQREVAQLLGLKTAERLSRWENGSAKPLPGTLFKLAAIYHVSPQELFSEFFEATEAETSVSTDEVLSGAHIQLDGSASHPAWSNPLTSDDCVCLERPHRVP